MDATSERLRRRPQNRSPHFHNRHCAKYYRHLGRQIRRCLIAIPNADVRTIAEWCYREPSSWAMSNIKRHCRVYSIKVDMTDGRKTRWQSATLTTEGRCDEIPANTRISRYAFNLGSRREAAQRVLGLEGSNKLCPT